MTFDISSLAIQESTVLHLSHPSNDEKLYADKDGKMTFEKTDKAGKANAPVTITVASTSSREYRQIANALSNRRIKRGKKSLTAEQGREEGVELLAACCLDSDNLVYKGHSVKSEQDFKALLADAGMEWIKSQVDECIGSAEAFIN